MKFKLDENVPSTIKKILTENELDVLTVSDENVK